MTETSATIAATTALLLAKAEREKYFLSADLRVNERDAAKLLGYSAAYLKNMRQQGNGPVFYVVGMNGSRISYRLQDVATWIEMGRSN